MTKSKGLGDSIEKALKVTGIDKVAKKVLGDLLVELKELGVGVKS